MILNHFYLHVRTRPGSVGTGPAHGGGSEGLWSGGLVPVVTRLLWVLDQQEVSNNPTEAAAQSRAQASGPAPPSFPVFVFWSCFSSCLGLPGLDLSFLLLKLLLLL